jgi:hypothetical protein
LRPGFLTSAETAGTNPGLKRETWATRFPLSGHTTMDYRGIPLLVLKWHARSRFFPGCPCKVGILRGIPQTQSIDRLGVRLVSASWYRRFASHLYRSTHGLLVSGPHVCAFRQVGQEPCQRNTVSPQLVLEEEPVRQRLQSIEHTALSLFLSPGPTRWMCVSSTRMLCVDYV